MLPVLGVICYAIHCADLRRFKLSINLLKFFSINIEVEGKDRPAIGQKRPKLRGPLPRRAAILGP